jgi:amino-acid N-acetyltransferase
MPEIEALLRACELPAEGITRLVDRFVVAEREGILAGCAAVERAGSAGLLRSVAVVPGVRGTGVGRNLVQAAITRAAGEGTQDFYLLTTTAERYFGTLGFQVIERDRAPEDLRKTDEFSSACPASATLMFRRWTTPAVGGEAN